MNKEHIEWCTDQLNQTWREPISGVIDLEGSTLHCIKRYTLYSNGYKGRQGNYAYALMKNEKFQAMRIYGMGKVKYKYIQYIVGVGLQVVGNDGSCILINKSNPLVSPYFSKILPPPVSLISSKIQVNSDVDVTKWRGQICASFLSLYGLAYAPEYYEIVCLNFYFDVKSADYMKECIETLGLYGKYLSKVVHGTSEKILILARSERVYLKYFSNLEELK